MDIIVTADLYYAVAAVLSDLALKLVGQHPEIAEAVSTHFTMRRRGRITDAVTEEAVAAFVRDFGTAVGADARVAWLLPLGLLTIITEGNAYEYANDRLEVAATRPDDVAGRGSRVERPRVGKHRA